jgi:hypothetical protein
LTSIPLLKSDWDKTIRIGKILRVLRDVFPFYRPEYYLIAGPQDLCFFSVLSGRKVCRLAEIHINETDEQVISVFLAHLKSSGYYFGQEITLLLPEPATYTMLKSQDKIDLDGLRKECSVLMHRETLQQVHSVGFGDKNYYVVSGLDGAYLAKIQAKLEDQGFLVSGVMSLSGFILARMLDTRINLKSRRFAIILGKYMSFISLADYDQPIYYELMDNLDDEPGSGGSLEQVIDSVSSGSLRIMPIFASSRRDANSQTYQSKNIQWNPLEKFFRFSLKGPDRAEFTLKKLIPPMTKYGVIAANSARLLNFTLVSLLILTSLVAITFSVIGNGSENLYNQYHEKLSQVYGVESELAMVESQISSLNTDHFSVTNFSAHLSVFCQKVPYDLCLTELHCQPTSIGNIQVIARGKARKETSVFRYKNILGEIATGIDFKIKSISRLAPNAVGPDSLAYRFVLATE